MRSLKRWLLFNRMYFGAPPWDTGVSPPELLQFVQTHRPGRALDLGCGTGTNVITLAQHGWAATGVDFAVKAIGMAKRKAASARVRARFVLGDVSRLPDLGGPFDLVLDIGCFHGLDDAHKAAYAAQMDGLLAPGGTFLLYAHLKMADSRRGVTEADLQRFSPNVALRERVDGNDVGRGHPSTWLTYVKA